jgi:nucleoside-diphosphate kinase
MEKTLVLIKPDAFQRSLVGKIITRLEIKGLKLIGAKMIIMSSDMLDKHYSHLIKLDFFSEIKNFMSSGPILATCWEGLEAAATVRKVCGITKAREADPGTIRGDFGMSIQCNLIHASEDLEASKRELSLFFSENEIFEYDLNNVSVIYSISENQ